MFLNTSTSFFTSFASDSIFLSFLTYSLILKKCNLESFQILRIFWSQPCCKQLQATASSKSAYTAAFICLAFLFAQNVNQFSLKIAKFFSKILKAPNQLGIVNGVILNSGTWRLLVRNLELVYCQSNLPKLEILPI